MLVSEQKYTLKRLIQSVLAINALRETLKAGSHLWRAAAVNKSEWSTFHDENFTWWLTSDRRQSMTRHIMGGVVLKLKWLVRSTRFLLGPIINKTTGSIRVFWVNTNSVKTYGSFQNHPNSLEIYSHYMVLRQTFLYRISTMQSFKSYQ